MPRSVDADAYTTTGSQGGAQSIVMVRLPDALPTVHWSRRWRITFHEMVKWRVVVDQCKAGGLRNGGQPECAVSHCRSNGQPDSTWDIHLNKV